MRIVILSPKVHGTSGNGKVGLELATGLIKEGHQVFCIGTNYNDIPTEKHNRGVSVPILPSFFDPRMRRGENIGKIAKYLTILDAELLIAIGDPYYLSEDCFGNLKIKEGKCDYVAYATVDSEGEFCRVQQTKEGKKNILETVDTIVTTSKYGEKEVKNWGYDVHSTIHEFVDIEFFKPADAKTKSELRKKYNIGEDETVLLHIGRPTARKRQEIMFEGVAKYILENEKVKLLTLIPRIASNDSFDVYDMEDYVGRVLKKRFDYDFFDKERIMMVKGTNLEDGLDINQVRDLYNLSDLYVSSTGGEGFGLPHCECMACGIPAIIPNNTTGPEILGMNKTTPENLPFVITEGGLLLDTPHRINIGFGLVQYHTDCDIMYEGIKYLVENPNVVQSLQKSCVDRAKLFSLGNFNDRWKFFVKSLEDARVEKKEDGKDKSKVS